MAPVSVIIPTYNRAALLDAAIRSVLDQTCTAREIIVIDDGSTDDTKAVVERYKDAVRYIYQDHRGHWGSARDRGIGEATGAYIAFLDSDDLWLPDKLARQLAYAEQHPHVGLIYCDAWYFDDVSGSNLYRWLSRCQCAHGWVGPALLQNLFMLMPTVLMRRAVLDDVGPFGTWPDLDILLRIAAHYQVGLVADSLARIRLHAGNSSRCVDPWDDHRIGLTLIERACAHAPAVYQPAKRRAVFAQYYRTIGVLVARGRTQEARTLFAEAVRLEPQLAAQILRDIRAFRNAG
jgi:glycosyltransferase involved in cell wall biosynthesis